MKFVAIDLPFSSPITDSFSLPFMSRMGVLDCGSTNLNLLVLMNVPSGVTLTEMEMFNHNF